MLYVIMRRRVPLQKIFRTFSTQSSTSDHATSQPVINTNVTGLSDSCVKIPNTPVGPNASKTQEYKNPEYFCYHVDTFAEAEVELAKYRLPVPSNKAPFK